MNTNRITKNIIFFLIVINLYLIINLFKGDNNIFNYFEYKEKNATLSLKIDETIKTRYQYMKLNELLSKENIDIDALDEVVRQLLQVSKPDEKIILLNDEDKKHFIKD